MASVRDSLAEHMGVLHSLFFENSDALAIGAVRHPTLAQ
jgi:hypothetical protein